ncbi:MAG: hypothetical protein K940chlam6_00549 [Chlamydiae bacterium]|nr:hypothetical protein [Chlamydiota bacterium]
MEESERISYRRPICIFTSLVLGGIGIALGAKAVLETDVLAKVFFGVFSCTGTSQASLLPLALFQKKWSRANTFEAVYVSGISTAIGYSGLYAFTDANLWHYSLPVIVVTWLYAAKIIHQQGVDVSVGNSKPTGKLWTWSILNIYKSRDS